MKPQTTLSLGAPMVQVLARGVCPICALMREFQNAMVESPHRYPARTLCNFHAWSLAGSSPAVEATLIFRSMLEESGVKPSSGVLELHPCDWCVTLREHEDEKLSESNRGMKRDNFRSRIIQYGTVCIFHGRRLIQVLPGSDAEIIRQILTGNLEELERQLEAFDVRVRRGEKGGGGILGHIAGFVVSQRGITR